MGSAEIIKVLEKSEEWMTAREIAEITKISIPTISRTLKRLTVRGEILRTESFPKTRQVVYKYRAI